MTKVKILSDTEHGDWKTRSVFPERWPTLKKGTEVEFLYKWNNLYGTWIAVKGENGKIYDIDPRDIEITK